MGIGTLTSHKQGVLPPLKAPSRTFPSIFVSLNSFLLDISLEILKSQQELLYLAEGVKQEVGLVQEY